MTCSQSPAGRTGRSETVLAYLRARAVDGMEVVGALDYARVIRRGNGPAGIIRVDFREPDPAGPAVVLTPSRSTLDGQDICNRIFGFGIELEPAETMLMADSALRPIIARQRGLRIPGTPDPFELAVRAILGQQISVARAARLAATLVERCGERVSASAYNLAYAFPGPDALTQADLAELRIPEARRRAISELSRRVVHGDVVLDGSVQPAEATAMLVAVPGIGPWTAAYIGLRGLGDLDAFPVQDLGLRTAIRPEGGPVTADQLAIQAEAWRPFRGLAAVHLWTTLLPEFRTQPQPPNPPSSVA